MFEPFETINKQLWTGQGKPPESDSIDPIARVGWSLGGSHEVNDGQHAESKRYEGGSQKNENEKVHCVLPLNVNFSCRNENPRVVVLVF